MAITSSNLDPASFLTVDPATVREQFAALCCGPIPRNASPSLLRGHVAWANQARLQGQNPVELRASLVRLARATTPAGPTLLKPGTRLIREWHGVTHEVTVEEDGFTWCGRRFRSLSQIAREITGTKWSGPRFFGLKSHGG